MIASSCFLRDEEKIEHCGVVGACSKKGKPVAQQIYRAMVALQHRGQDAAGFVLWDNGFVEKKGIGFVTDIFKDADLSAKGTVGIGHTRYPTTGLCLISDVQPFNNINIAVSHNGQVSNYKDARKELEKRGFKFVSTVDSEVVVYLLHEQLREGKSVEDAVKHLMESVDGAYSITALIGDTLVAFKDPNGIRPLVWGESQDTVMLASETTALDANGIPHKGDLGPGELAIVRNGKMEIKKIKDSGQRACMFEYVYFSRPDSTINGKNVMDVRKRLGAELAREHPVNADVVIEVPDSARTAAAAYAKELGIPHDEGLIKNRYVGRTFIMPSQQKRTDAVRMKLNAVSNVVAGRRVALIDDSLVRGTTMKEIVSLVRNAGAKEVHVRLTCPPIRAPCFYGIDMSTYKELAAHTKTIPEIGKMVGADSIGYISLEGLKKAIGLQLCTGCLDEGYPTQYAKKLADEQKDK
ncbi:Glutamine--fructose-6-phosphate aminotransferase [isomerizing] [Candidatus Burarchaeum australiense]|nr:Glutamine--fructose-6-phosphate aminotransferase [isomerizing] [Candidatus Burarchaeum australiense]